MKKAGDHHPWWFIGPNSLPSQAILARSTGNGVVKPGLTVYLIGGHDREVFVGENCDKFKIHEYVGLVDGTGWQPLVQLGRDVEMIDN
jgi:hypothetical protein